MRPSLRRRLRVPEGAVEKIDLLERILLNRISCDEFMDEKHCLYARQVLARWLMGLTEVWVGREYVIAVVKDGSTTMNYLIGRDSDSGLLFINKVWISNDNVNEVRGRLLAESEKIRVYAVRDADVKRIVLGYNYDVAESPYTINKPGAYRVQGDVVARVQSITQDAVERIIERISLMVSELAVVDFIIGLLIERDIGATTDIPPMNLVTARGTWSEREPITIEIQTALVIRHRGEVAMRIASIIAEELGKYFGAVLKVAPAGNHENPEDLVIAEPAESGDRSILLLSPRNYAIMMVVRGAPSPLLNRIRDDVRSALLDYLHSSDGAVDTTLKVGRHLVILNRVKSATFTLNTAQFVNMHYLNDRNITVQLIDPPGYVVNEDSVITLRHIQHREKTLRFTGEFLVTITHTRTSPDYVDELNAVVLNSLLKDNNNSNNSNSPQASS